MNKSAVTSRTRELSARRSSVAKIVLDGSLLPADVSAVNDVARRRRRSTGLSAAAGHSSTLFQTESDRLPWYMSRPPHVATDDSALVVDGLNDRTTATSSVRTPTTRQRTATSSGTVWTNGCRSLDDDRTAQSDRRVPLPTSGHQSNVDQEELLRMYFPTTIGLTTTARNSPRQPCAAPVSALRDASDDVDELREFERTKSCPAVRSAATSRTGEQRIPTTTSTTRSSTGRRSRPTSNRSSSCSSTSNGSFDRIGLSDVGTAVATLVSSPYQSEISRLRLDQLRIQEEHLLEMKRLSELERTRGPQPKWYELRSSQFHEEVRRNNQLMKNRTSWQALLDYRSELESASGRFNQQS